MLSSLAPFFPTKKQICEWNYSAEVRCKLEEFAMSILRHLLLPLLKLWRGRRARKKLVKELLQRHFQGDSNARRLCERAILQRSALARVSPFLDFSSPSDAVLDNPSKPVEGRSERGPGEGRAADLESSSQDPASGSASTSNGAVPIPASTSTSLVFRLATSSQQPGLSVSREDCVESKSLLKRNGRRSEAAESGAATAVVREAVAHAVHTKLAFRVYLQGELVQSPMEPAHEVLIVLEGSLARVVPDKIGSSDVHAVFPPKLLLPSAVLTASAGASLPNLSWHFYPGSDNSSLQLGAQVGVDGGGGGGGGRGAAAANSPGASDASAAMSCSVVDKQAPPARWRSTRLFAQKYTLYRDVLTAPLVLGEHACVGGFPFCTELLVHSGYALIASLPLHAYCQILSVLPSKSQRRLLIDSLKQRQLLMSYFAPMTHEWLCVCPILSGLKPQHFDELREHLAPRVYAAGMLCSESTDPQHIFFVRRGLVCVEHESQNVLEAFSPHSPCSRTILTAGQTFGELQCIFHENLGDLFYALTHVDVYVLRFERLMQLMKRCPEVHAAVFAAASLLSKIQATPSRAFRFVPRGWEGLRGDRLRALARRHDVATAVLHATATAEAGARPKLRSSLSRGERGETPGALPPGGEPFPATRTFAGAPAVDVGASPSNFSLLLRRDLARFARLMKSIPLLGWVATEEDLATLARQWGCLLFRKGDVVVRRGEECDRLLYLAEGTAGVVVRESAVRAKVPGLSCFTAAVEREAVFDGLGPGEIFPIPAGHTVGYTCVRRHRWVHTIVAMEDNVEVWVLERAALMSFLCKFKLDQVMQSATLQLLQPLYLQPHRTPLLDYQPLLASLPNSFWSEQPIPNLHPVSMVTNKVLYPVWEENDFSLT